MMSMSALPDSLAGWIVAALLLFWFVGAYNRLVRLRVSLLQAYRILDAALLRQLEFVQARVAAEPEVPSHDPVSPTASLLAATTQLATLLNATRLRPLDPGGMAALATALQVLVIAWQRHYPDAVTVFDADGTLSSRSVVPVAGLPVAVPDGVAVPIGWPEPSAAAEIARSQFNQAVGGYNAAIRQFPAMLVAWMFRLHPAARLL